MANKTEEIVLALAEPIAADEGADVVDVEFKKEGGDWFLRVYIDKDGGVSIDDCENVSRRLSDMLDEKDPIEQNYILEVSSPGADRILKKEREFLYYIGREVDVKLYKASDMGKEFSGTLAGYADKTAEIDCGGDMIKVPLADAAYIRLSFGGI